MSQPVIICQKWLLRHVLHGGLVTLMCGKLVIKTNIQKWSIRWDNIRSFWLLAWRGVVYEEMRRCRVLQWSPGLRSMLNVKGHIAIRQGWVYFILFIMKIWSNWQFFYHDFDILQCFLRVTCKVTDYISYMYNLYTTKIIRHFIVEKSFEYPPLAATGHSQDIVGPDSSHSGTSVWGEREMVIQTPTRTCASSPSSARWPPSLISWHSYGVFNSS